MPAVSPAQRRLGAIEIAEAEVARLLKIALQESIKAELHTASRDLNEARLWLRQKHVDQRPGILFIIDSCVQLAQARLEAVDQALKTYGPNAMAIE